MRILRSYQPGETVELRILRDRRAQTLKGEVPERARHEFRLRHVEPPPAPAAPAAPAEGAARS